MRRRPPGARTAESAGPPEQSAPPFHLDPTTIGWLLRTFVLLLLSCRLTSGAAPNLTEYQVKAAYIYNFTQFMDWPTNAFATTNAPVVIGILGEDPFGRILDEVVRNEVVRGRPLVVKRLRPDEDLRDCCVLFISRSEKERLPAVLHQLRGSPVLTISDSNGFAQQGGMVNLILVNQTVKMEINQTAVETAGLQVSSKLLKLARIVKP